MVSHHSPVTALHATDEKDNIEMTWCQYAIPKFYVVGQCHNSMPRNCLEVELCFKGNSFLGRRGNYRSSKGKILSSTEIKTIYEINGHWDSHGIKPKDAKTTIEDKERELVRNRKSKGEA
ncbi:hypothetical protein L6452_12776 [Arctium lappa]|uniref:Uncharacterized protein n=1 Tax=Arctium lappa TaxID=4217 RepID=A0ACB9CGF4_ARCLA|nr:hypothetical protein L6452_12776 [Arctium lappa]